MISIGYSQPQITCRNLKYKPKQSFTLRWIKVLIY